MNLSKDDEKFLELYSDSIYDKPSVTIDNVILRFRDIENNNYRKHPDKKLQICLIKRAYSPYKDCYAVPGTFIDLKDSLSNTLKKCLENKIGLKDFYFEQLYTFGDEQRDPRTRVISIAYLILTNKQEQLKNCEWFDIDFQASKNEFVLTNNGYKKAQKIKITLTNKNTTFPCSETDYDAGNLYWDTSNRGANSISQMDPTNKSTDFVIAGTYAAKLQSVKVLGSIFAAASMYTGSFGGASMDMSATINFGRSFTSRPIALHGYYQYSPANVDAVGDNLPADATVSEGNPDQCAIYVALTKKAYTINNKQEDTFIDFEGDENIIAYGTIEGDYVKTNGAANGYTEFTIPLQYKESQFGAIPTHIIIVCSASKYGDYFTGGEGSTLYVDDFSLVYDGAPAIWKNK